MDEGLPIAYELVEPDIAVLAAGGEQVGTVDHVVSAPEEDIFHGLVIDTDAGKRFVPAEDVSALHERAADLKLSAADVAALPEPHGGAPAWRPIEPGADPHRWKHIFHWLTARDVMKDDWSLED